MKNEAWQGKGTGRNAGEDKGCNLASHDSAPSLCRGELGRRETSQQRKRELEDLELQGPPAIPGERKERDEKKSKFRAQEGLSRKCSK